MKTPGSVLYMAALLVAACATVGALPAEAERITEMLALQAGQAVADVGAGDGEWSVPLARNVGPAGHVFATEVDEDEIEEIQERFQDAGLENVTVVMGDQEQTGLPAGCCDAILLRLVYHHFTDPAAMRADLRQALRPGGRLLVIDIVPQTFWRELEDVPDRGGHGITMDELIADLSGDGFRVLEQTEDWFDDEDKFAVLFQRLPEGD